MPTDDDYEYYGETLASLKAEIAEAQGRLAAHKKDLLEMVAEIAAKDAEIAALEAENALLLLAVENLTPSPEVTTVTTT